MAIDKEVIHIRHKEMAINTQTSECSVPLQDKRFVWSAMMVQIQTLRWYRFADIITLSPSTSATSQ